MKRRAPLPAASVRTLAIGAGAGVLAAGVAAFGAYHYAASEMLLYGLHLSRGPEAPADLAAAITRAGQWWRYYSLAPADLTSWSPAQRALLVKALTKAQGVGIAAAAAAAALPLFATWGALKSWWERYRPAEAVIRGKTDNHGHADWMDMAEARALFAGPHGVAVGEAVRMDQTAVARIPFHPRDKRTWGPAGQAPLLIDSVELGSGHHIVVAGSGAYKTQSILTTFTTWQSGIFAFDPSCELGDLVRELREDMGKKVIILDAAGANGFNALEWIDINDPEAEVKIRAEVDRIYGQTQSNSQAQNGDFFRDSGKSLLTGFLAHLLWDPHTPPEEKTLETLRRGITRPSSALRDVMRDIHHNSPSLMARQLTSDYELVAETFDGIVRNMLEGTAWLSVPAYARMVSGNTFSAADLASGEVDVICQIPLNAMLTAPEVGRVVLGACFNSIFEKKGQAAQTLFQVDEAVLFGAMKEFRVVRDQGRKYRITLGLYYQAEGQIEEAWGKPGMEAWYASLSWRAYAAVQTEETAERVSKRLGTYGVEATSHGSNTGNSGKAWESKSRSKGSNENTHEQKRNLMNVSEILTDMRDDERLVFFRGRMPLRCRSPIAFCREDVRRKLGESSFAPRLELSPPPGQNVAVPPRSGVPVP